MIQKFSTCPLLGVGVGGPPWPSPPTSNSDKLDISVEPVVSSGDTQHTQPQRSMEIHVEMASKHPSRELRFPPEPARPHEIMHRRHMFGTFVSRDKLETRAAYDQALRNVEEAALSHVPRFLKNLYAYWNKYNKQAPSAKHVVSISKFGVFLSHSILFFCVILPRDRSQKRER